TAADPRARYMGRRPIGRTSRVSGLTMRPSVSSVTAPSSGASSRSPRTTGEVAVRRAISKRASGAARAMAGPCARPNAWVLVGFPPRDHALGAAGPERQARLGLLAAGLHEKPRGRRLARRPAAGFVEHARDAPPVGRAQVLHDDRVEDDARDTPGGRGEAGGE